MDAFAKLITSIASLAWPAIFALAMIKFFEPIKALIESARNRKFAIKIAGNELTMEEASEQQRAIISDLAQKIAMLEEFFPQYSKSKGAADFDSRRNQSRRILWVDDRPRNNSLLVATIEERGATVDVALNTDQGIEFSERNKYDAIVSDMGRPEGDHAGIDFAHKFRARNKSTPIYIFCGSWAANNLREESLRAGVNEITSSGTSILALLWKEDA